MDNHYVNIASSSASCGVVELSGISSEPVNVLYGLATRLYHPSRGSPAVFAMWSDVPESNGQKLWSEIGNRFGFNALLRSEYGDNPLTGNPICIYIWQIPHECFRDWYKLARIARLKKL